MFVCVYDCVCVWFVIVRVYVLHFSILYCECVCATKFFMIVSVCMQFCLCVFIMHTVDVELQYVYDIILYILCTVCACTVCII